MDGNYIVIHPHSIASLTQQTTAIVCQQESCYTFSLEVAGLKVSTPLLDLLPDRYKQ
jgi:hypothetical protein